MSEKKKLKPLARKIAKLLVENQITYSQSRYIILEARRIAGLKPPKKRKGSIPTLSTTELDLFLKTANEQKNGKQKKLMVKTLYLTAARVSEFAALQVTDIYIKEQKVIIRKGKGEKRREVPITSHFAETLDYYIGKRKEGPLFYNQRNSAYAVRTVQDFIKRIAIKSGIDTVNITPHIFRHSRLTHLAEKGMEIERLKEFAGHEDIMTTMHYLETANFKLKEQFRKLEGLEGDIV